MEEKLVKQLSQLKEDLCSTLDLITPMIGECEQRLKGLPLPVRLVVLDEAGEEALNDPRCTEEDWERLVHDHWYYTLTWLPRGCRLLVTRPDRPGVQRLRDASGEIRLDVYRRGKLDALVRKAVEEASAVVEDLTREQHEEKI